MVTSKELRPRLRLLKDGSSVPLLLDCLLKGIGDNIGPHCSRHDRACCSYGGCYDGRGWYYDQAQKGIEVGGHLHRIVNAHRSI